MGERAEIVKGNPIFLKIWERMGYTRAYEKPIREGQRMNRKHRYIVYEREGADPQNDRVTFTLTHDTITIVTVPESGAVLHLAPQWIQEGVTSIELCGGMGATVLAQLIKVVGTNFPVSAVLYGFESLTSVAAYKHRYEIGDAPFVEAFIIYAADADSTVHRQVVTSDMGSTTFVCVTDETATDVVKELRTQGAQLIELYDPSAQSLERVLEASGNGAIPVGVSVRL